MFGDFNDKTVVITEPGNGMGEACAVLFADAGAKVFLTKDAPSGNGNFSINNTSSSNRIESHCVDLAKSQEIRAFLEKVKGRKPKIDIIVTCFQESQHWNQGIPDEKAFLYDIENIAWPYFDILNCVYDVFDSGPRYSLAVLEEIFSPKVNAGEMSRSLVEVLLRYMTIHLGGEKVNLNVIKACRPSRLKTDLNGNPKENVSVSNEEVAQTALTLCSGLLDAMSGQVLILDKGLRCTGSA